MLHKFNVKVLSQHGEIPVYAGTDGTTALTVYAITVQRESSENFIELYKDGKFQRSTIGRL